MKFKEALNESVSKADLDMLKKTEEMIFDAVSNVNSYVTKDLHKRVEVLRRKTGKTFDVACNKFRDVKVCKHCGDVNRELSMTYCPNCDKDY